MIDDTIDGNLLSWNDIVDNANFLKDKSYKEIIHLWPSIKRIESPNDTWGDEIEYQLVCIDDKAKRVYLSLRQQDVLDALLNHDEGKAGSYSPEYAKWQVESMPSKPYGILSIDDIMRVEENMRNRREAIKSHLRPNESVATVSLFPKLGRQGQFDCHTALGKVPCEDIPNDNISPDPRYKALSNNVQIRRKSKVRIAVPVFKDTNTAWPWLDPSMAVADARPEDENHILLENLAFSGGGCGLQVTFQSRNMKSARRLHDRLIPLGPLMLAMTASTPIYKGYLADSDVRWNYFSHAMDPPGTPASQKRWLCNPMYLRDDLDLPESYANPHVSVYREVQQMFEDAGVDQKMSKFLTFLHQHEPLVMSKDVLEPADPTKDAEIFQSFCGCVWPHVDLKFPPKPGSSKECEGKTKAKNGWRVEFRPMETQLTDFENSAFVITLALLAEALTYFDMDLYMPIRKVEENFDNAHKRNAVVTEQFWFKTNPHDKTSDNEDDFDLWTIDELFNGQHPKTNGATANGAYTNGTYTNGTYTNGTSTNGVATNGIVTNGASTNGAATNGATTNGHRELNGMHGQFEGFISLIRTYLKDAAAPEDVEKLGQVEKYLEHVAAVASGDRPTTSQFIRNFVRQHPEYKFDSDVPAETCYDLFCEIDRMNNFR